MKKSVYDNQEIVPVGFLDADNNQVLAAAGTSTAFAAETTVRVTPTAGIAWIAINATPTATADTQGSHPVEQAQDFAVEIGDKINSTNKLVITPFK
jgi:hypothetical protein